MKNMDTARVLIVDDQIHALHGMSKIIRDAGHEPIEASNGTDCLKLATEHKPDLILLDLGLPDINGREVCRRIKSDPDTTDIYVVIVSSVYTESDFQSEGLEHGADGYIARPIPNREFLARVEAILRLKYAERRLRESEERFRRMFRNHSSVMLLTDPETGRIIDANRAAERFYGYSASQLLSMCIQDINALPVDEVEAHRHFALATQSNSFIVQQRLANGEIRTVEVHSSPIEQNAANCLFSIVDDITDRQETENRLLETEQKRADELLQITVHRFHTILSSLYAGVLVVTEEGRTDFANQAFCDLFDIKDAPAKLQGLSRNVMLQRINQVYAEPDESINRIRTIVARGLPVKGEEIAIREGRTYLRDFVPLFIDGKRYGRLWLHHDFTEHKRAEEAVLRLAAIVESSDDAIISKTLDGNITSWNGGAERLYGYKMEEIIGQPISTLLPPEALDDLPDILTKISRGEVIRHFETKRRTKDGRIVDVSLSISPLKTPQGQIIGASSTARDITERKRLEMERLETERKVLHAQKLESLGVMAEGIAHDFNNLLMVILGNLDIALDDLPLDSTARHSIENAIQAAERSAELSRQMQIYTGSALKAPVDLDLNELLRKNSVLLKLGFSEHVNLNLDCYDKLPSITGDATQIQRLVMNILVNALESIGDKQGAVHLSTGVVDCDEMYLSHSRIETKPEPGRFVFLEITDTGCGMAPETLRRLFDPFFTTKFTGRGLGMSEALGIVKSHGGALFAVSQLGKGTTIRVLFPVSKRVQAPSFAGLEAEDIRLAAPHAADRRRTILLVEDETLVRDLTVGRLNVLGYDTIVAEDGEEGVRIFRERLNEIDLVMLDYKMPRMNGVEAFGEFIRIKPDVKVMICSGYTEDTVMQSFPDRHPNGVLHKPYSLGALRAELARLLGTTD